MSLSFSDGLPPRELWPELIFNRPELQYPLTLNVAETLVGSGPRPEHADRIAVIHRETALSYAALGSLVAECAIDLVRAGIEPGDRVTIRLPNSPDYVIAWLAVLWIGAIAVPIPMAYRRREIAYIVNHCDARLMICHADSLGDIGAARPRFISPVEVLVLGKDQRLRPEPTNSRAVPHPSARHEPAVITYISSAQGPMRGVVHTPADLLAATDTYARDVLRLSANDVCIGTIPLTYAFGAGALLLFPLRAGATTVLVDSESPQLLATISRRRATVLFGVPTMYRILLRQPDLDSFDLSSLRCAVSAAEPLPANVAREWRRRTGVEILDGLGTTELTHIVISARPGDQRIGSLGTVVAGYEARIVDEAFRSVPTGSPGLLAVRGPTGCRYWRDTEAQRSAVHDGWTITGDICMNHSDDSFEHVRRVDDLIVTGGYKVSIREVEQALEDHPAVARARVYACEDPVRGQVPKASVIPQGGIDVAGLAEILKLYLKQELAPFKCPREIVVAKP
jgi:2-aminobenzoate-CoA ligase